MVTSTMPYICWPRESLFEMCFGSCMKLKKGTLSPNRVGSTNDLDQIGSNPPNPKSGQGDNEGLVKNKNFSSNEKSNSSDNETKFEGGGIFTREVIIKQPINKIKIVNVTYQKTLHKNNTVNKKRIFNAVDGHVNNTRNSFDASSSDTCQEGGKYFDKSDKFLNWE